MARFYFVNEDRLIDEVELVKLLFKKGEGTLSFSRSPPYDHMVTLILHEESTEEAFPRITYSED